MTLDAISVAVWYDGEGIALTCAQCPAWAAVHAVPVSLAALVTAAETHQRCWHTYTQPTLMCSCGLVDISAGPAGRVETIPGLRDPSCPIHGATVAK